MIGFLTEAGSSFKPVGIVYKRWNHLVFGLCFLKIFWSLWNFGDEGLLRLQKYKQVLFDLETETFFEMIYDLFFKFKCDTKLILIFQAHHCNLSHLRPRRCQGRHHKEYDDFRSVLLLKLQLSQQNQPLLGLALQLFKLH